MKPLILIGPVMASICLIATGAAHGQAVPAAPRAAVVAAPPEPPELRGLEADLLRNAHEGLVSELFAPAGRLGQPLIIRTGQIDPTKLANLQEDLTVMTRILNKAVEDGPGRGKQQANAMGIVLSSMGDPRRPQSIYLEGYGALFFLSVKFPLIPTPETKEQEKEKPADTDWERTRQELFGPRDPNRGWFKLPQPATMEYEAERVEDLKKDVFAALKNASNIRHLKPDESIVIAVLGGETAGSDKVIRSRLHAVVDVEAASRRTLDWHTPPRAHSRETVLTIRVKKSDVDAFAKEKLTLDELQKKAVVLAY